MYTLSSAFVAQQWWQQAPDLSSWNARLWTMGEIISEGASYLFVCLFVCLLFWSRVQAFCLSISPVGPSDTNYCRVHLCQWWQQFSDLSCKVLHNLVKSFLRRHPAYSGVQALWLSCTSTWRLPLKSLDTTVCIFPIACDIAGKNEWFPSCHPCRRG